jgi:hypothetical protein
MALTKGLPAVIGLTCLVTAGVAVSVWAAQRGDDGHPWTAGRCYRVLFLDPAQQQTLRVLENPVGPWVRVQSDPRGTRVPGATPRGRVWLNTATVFAIEETDCSSLPGH